MPIIEVISYEDANFRNTVRQRLYNKLKEHAGKRIMLIGHSMGSIIAYDVLRIIGRQTPPVPVDHFVTIRKLIRVRFSRLETVV